MARINTVKLKRQDLKSKIEKRKNRIIIGKSMLIKKGLL